MSTIKEITKEFKLLTGYKMTDLADNFKVSKQQISLQMKNYSLTHKSANAYMFYEMIDKRIEELQSQVVDLQCLKMKIKNYARRE